MRGYTRARHIGQGDLADAQARSRRACILCRRRPGSSCRLPMLVNNGSEFSKAGVHSRAHRSRTNGSAIIAINLAAPALSLVAICTAMPGRCADGQSSQLMTRSESDVEAHRRIILFSLPQLSQKSACGRGRRQWRRRFAPARNPRPPAMAGRPTVLEYTAKGRVRFPQADGGDTAEARCHAGKKSPGPSSSLPRRRP